MASGCAILILAPASDRSSTVAARRAPSSCTIVADLKAGRRPNWRPPGGLSITKCSFQRVTADDEYATLHRAGWDAVCKKPIRVKDAGYAKAEDKSRLIPL